MDLGLLRGLGHVGSDALAERGQFLRGQRLRGPGPEQSLIEQVLIIAVRGWLVIHHRLLGGIQSAPAGQGSPPFLGEFRQHIDTGPHVLAALGIVG
jgi:hypothetical protein